MNKTGVCFWGLSKERFLGGVEGGGDIHHLSFGHARGQKTKKMLLRSLAGRRRRRCSFARWLAGWRASSPFFLSFFLSLFVAVVAVVDCVIGTRVLEAFLRFRVAGIVSVNLVQFFFNFLIFWLFLL